MKRMFILKKLFIYRKMDKFTTEELNLQIKLNELVDTIDQKFDQDKKMPLAESKDILKAARERGQDVYSEWEELDRVIYQLNVVRDKKKELYLKLI